MKNKPAISKLKKRPSIADEIYDRLRSSILSGQFKPGQRLVERTLAEEFGISRTPLREAIHNLEREGLLDALPTRGVVVTRVSNAEIENIFDIRQALEGYAGGLAAKRIKEVEIKNLERIHSETLQTLADGEMSRIVKLNMKFHETVYSASRNARLLSWILDLRAYIFSRQLQDSGSSSTVERSIEEHRLIIEALKERDAEKTEKLIRRHLVNALNALLAEKQDSAVIGSDGDTLHKLEN